MKIERQPRIESLLKEQVEAGLFNSLEEAVAAAVTATFAQPGHEVDLSWAKPFLAQADRDIQEGRALGHTAVWDRVGKRFGS